MEEAPQRPLLMGALSFRWWDVLKNLPLVSLPFPCCAFLRTLPPSFAFFQITLPLFQFPTWKLLFLGCLLCFPQAKLVGCTPENSSDNLHVPVIGFVTLQQFLDRPQLGEHVEIKIPVLTPRGICFSRTGGGPLLTSIPGTDNPQVIFRDSAVQELSLVPLTQYEVL